MNMEDMDIMDKTINAYYNADAPATAAGEGVTRKVLAHSENLMVCELHYEKGAIGVHHRRKEVHRGSRRHDIQAA